MLLAWFLTHLHRRSHIIFGIGRSFLRNQQDPRRNISGKLLICQLCLRNENSCQRGSARKFFFLFQLNIYQSILFHFQNIQNGSRSNKSQRCCYKQRWNGYRYGDLLYTRLRLKGEGKKLHTCALDDFKKAFNVFSRYKKVHSTN